MKNDKKTTTFTALFMVAATLLAKLCGMLRDILIAGLYGTATDAAIAFSTASRIPLLFFDIALGSAITSAFIPVFNEYVATDREKKAFEFANSFINLIILVTVVVSALGMFFSKEVVMVFAGGLSGDKLELAASLTVILFPTIIFTALAYCFVGLLQSYGEFLIPAIISLVSNVVLILYVIVFGDKYGVHGVAIAMLVAWSTQCIVQIPSLIKIKYRFRPTLNFRDEGIRNVCKLAGPIILSTWMQPINTIVNMNLASTLNGGEAMTALDYANKIYILLVGVFTFTATNLIFPSLSRASAVEDDKKFVNILGRAIRYVVLIIVPVMIGFLFLSRPIIRLFYERGAFDEQSTNLTAIALFCYSFGMLGYAMQEMANKGFYAMQDGKTPMRVAISGIGANILLSILFVLVFKTGVGGLALASAVSSNIIGFSLLVILNRRKKGIITGSFLVFGAKVIAAVSVMGVAVLATKQFTAGFDKLTAVLIPAAAGALVYFVMCALLRVREFTDLFRLLISVLNRRERK